jgi:hypothetical protein
MAEKELERRIAQLEDIEAIRQLKARYCLYVDQRNEKAWVSLFTEDAAWESKSCDRKRTGVIVPERHLVNDGTPVGGEVVGNRIFFCSTLRGANERLEKDPTFARVRHVI